VVDGVVGLEAMDGGEAPPTTPAGARAASIEQSLRRPLVGARGANQGARNTVADVSFVQQRCASADDGGDACLTPAPRALAPRPNCTTA
jgi:hypothetical protein